MSARQSSDEGFALVELIIVIVLLGLMGSVVASILINSWVAQNQVTSTSQATNRGQLIGQSIERAVRNAQAIDVSADGAMLRVHTTQPGSKACQAFWFNSGSIYVVHTSGALPNAVVSSWPGAWQDRVVQHAGVPFLDPAGSTVDYTFDINTDASPVAFAGQAAMRTPTTGVTAPCW